MAGATIKDAPASAQPWATGGIRSQPLNITSLVPIYPESYQDGRCRNADELLGIQALRASTRRSQRASTGCLSGGYRETHEPVESWNKWRTLLLDDCRNSVQRREAGNLRHESDDLHAMRLLSARGQGRRQQLREGTGCFRTSVVGLRYARRADATRGIPCRSAVNSMFRNRCDASRRSMASACVNPISSAMNPPGTIAAWAAGMSRR